MAKEPYKYTECTKLTQYFAVIAETAPDAPLEVRYRMRKIDQNTFVTNDEFETKLVYVTQEEFEQHVEKFTLFKEMMEEVCEHTTDRIERIALQGEILRKIGGL